MMSNVIRKFYRAAAVAAAASVCQFAGPCESSLQHPPSNTVTIWGVAIALPKFVPVELTAPAADVALESAADDARLPE